MVITGVKKEKKIPLDIQVRQIKYLNIIVEQDHGFIKKRIRSMLGLKSFRPATSILVGVEGIPHIIKKEPVDVQKQSVQNQKQFTHQLFGLTA